jgi:hypothetical protein
MPSMSHVAVARALVARDELPPRHRRKMHAHHDPGSRAFRNSDDQSMLAPQFGQVRPPLRNSLRITGFLRCSCSRPHLGQVTFRSNPLPATTSQTEFKLRPHFPDLPAVSVAIISKTPASTTAIITTNRNAMLSILETLRYVRMTSPAFACVLKSARQTMYIVSRGRPLRNRYFSAIAGSYWPAGNHCRRPVVIFHRLCSRLDQAVRSRWSLRGP